MFWVIQNLSSILKSIVFLKITYIYLGNTTLLYINFLDSIKDLISLVIGKYNRQRQIIYRNMNSHV